MKTKKNVSEIERNRGGDASVGFAGNVSPVLNLPESAAKLKEEYQRLRSRDSKREFFKSGLTRIERNMPGAWARLYWFLELCRSEKWFWTEQGFESFESFWRENGKYAFEEIAKLEAMFNFAKVACPELFDLDLDSARRLWKETNRVSKRMRSFKTMNGSNTPLANLASAETFAYLDLDLHSNEFQQGFKQAYSGSAIRRYQRLKRLAPRVAKQVLQGHFVRHVKGEVKPDLASAEKAAGIYKTTSPKQRSKRFARRISKLTPSELGDLLKELAPEAKQELKGILAKS